MPTSNPQKWKKGVKKKSFFQVLPPEKSRFANLKYPAKKGFLRYILPNKVEAIL